MAAAPRRHHLHQYLRRHQLHPRVADGGAPASYLLTDERYNALGASDPRRAAWANAYAVAGTTYCYPFKHQQRNTTTSAGNATEHNNTLRLAEQYLIRAEARIRQGKVAAGLADLNVVRARAGAPALATSQS